MLENSPYNSFKVGIRPNLKAYGARAFLFQLLAPNRMSLILSALRIYMTLIFIWF